MGIRFYCPNGHKLNVKSHLAGRTGFCPECGVRLVIPLQSTRKSSHELEAERELKESNGSSAQNGTKPLDLKDLSPEQAAPSVPAPHSGNAPAFNAEEPENSGGITNPLLQDQTVVWYIQIPGGQQFGPANGQTVQGWIQERRITPTMLVWREGWANWLEAKNVFPELEL